MKVLKDPNKIASLFRLLSNKSNLQLLKEIQKNECYAIELEKKIGLDRSTIKKRLYAFVNVGLLETKQKRTPKKAIATYYKFANIEIPKVDISKMLNEINIQSIKKIIKSKQLESS